MQNPFNNVKVSSVSCDWATMLAVVAHRTQLFPQSFIGQNFLFYKDSILLSVWTCRKVRRRCHQWTGRALLCCSAQEHSCTWPQCMCYQSWRLAQAERSGPTSWQCLYSAQCCHCYWPRVTTTSDCDSKPRVITMHFLYVCVFELVSSIVLDLTRLANLAFFTPEWIM